MDLDAVGSLCLPGNWMMLVVMVGLPWSIAVRRFVRGQNPGNRDSLTALEGLWIDGVVSSFAVATRLAKPGKISHNRPEWSVFETEKSMEER